MTPDSLPRAASDAPRRAAFAALVDSPVAFVAAATGIMAGILHFAVAPMHFDEAIGQGLFMVGAGCAQVFWGLWFFRRPSYPAYIWGIGIAVATIFVWLLATFVGPPFGSGPEAPETIAYCTEAVEAITLVALLALPVPLRALNAAAMPRVTATLAAAIILGVALGGGAYGAGLIAEKVTPQLGLSQGSMMGDMPLATASTSGMSMGTGTSGGPSVQASGGNNSSSSANSSMPGMNMTKATGGNSTKSGGTPAANATAPPKTLAPVKIALTPDGSAESAKVTVDAGVMHLHVTIYLNASGTGAYAATGPSGGDLVLTVTAPGGSSAAKSVALTGTAATTGVDAGTGASKGPFAVAIDMPTGGTWTIAINGQGQNAEVDATLVESFTM
ncbi:MAG: hypothetical protein ACYDDF_13605 [Thermoplasmatota archaeon]